MIRINLQNIEELIISSKKSILTQRYVVSN